MTDTLQTYYDKHNGRLPTEPIPDESENDKPSTKCCKSKIVYSDKHKENICDCCGMGV